MNKILVIQTAFLGDVILATPIVSELKRLYPSATIDVLVKKGNESLLQGNPHLNMVHVFDKSTGKWKNILTLVKTFRKERYDLVINLHRFASSGIIAGFSKGKQKVGFKKNPFSFLYTTSFPHTIGDGTHEVERNLSLIASLGAERIVQPSLFPSAKDVAIIQQYAVENYVCMAPASVWFTKQLPKTKWIELTQLIPSDTSIYLLGAPGDQSLCDEIRVGSQRENVVNLAGELSLLQSAALMRNAIRNYVNDSGPLHLASSVNAPVTAFFCSTVPNFGFGPLSDDSEIKEVLNLDCRPCGLHGHKSCPEGHFKCGDIQF